MIQEIYDYIQTLPIIDTHEHLPEFESLRPRNDVISEFLTHYLSIDLVSAGLPNAELRLVKSEELGIMEKWQRIEKYWEACRFTGYAQAIELSAREIYGVDRICTDTIEALNDAYLRGFGENHYKKVLKDMSKIELSILDTVECWGDLRCDRDYFILSNRLDAMIRPKTGEDMVALERSTGVTVSSFENYLRACELRMEQYLASSHILKLGIAYGRSLFFPRVPRHEAEIGFNKLFKSGYYIDKEEQTYCCDSAFTSYVLHHLLGIAQEKGMILQIHTGMQEGNGNILAHSNPCNLNELFIEYPKLRFDLFHIGYPYQGELGALCKMFPNVYADMCWAHIISPVAARRTLNEWLELFSYRKISGFGGDYLFPDGVFGHQHIARRNIAETLSEKVCEGVFDAGTACEIGKALLYDNPKEIFRL